MNKKKEWLSLINKPWFRRMRGGEQLKLEKEGLEKKELGNIFWLLEAEGSQGPRPERLNPYAIT